MAEILHQLRLVLYLANPIKLQGLIMFYTSQVVVWDLFHQQYLETMANVQ